MKKFLKIFVILVVAGFVILQFFRPDRTNPPINEAETLEASTKVPPDVQMILARSCNDCHSSKTVWPWYSNISPASWFLADHIEDGRRHLNFSTWATYDNKKKLKRLEETCDLVKAREMPLPSYLWIHRSAKLSDSEIAAICEWTKAMEAELGGA